MATTHTGTTEKVTTLEQLYVEQLRDLYSAETQIIKALPKMIQAAQSEDLKKGFQHHLEQTEEHARRLETILSRAGQEAAGHTCKAMKGLVAEGEETLKEGEPGPVLDAGLIAAAQRIEHYEMAGYGTAISLAKHVGDTEAQAPLAQTLKEEKQTDEKLTKLAESAINPQASQKS